MPWHRPKPSAALHVGASEIEALRLELERVRANMQAARESARVEPEQPFAAMAPLPVVAVPEVTVQPVVEPEPAAFAAFEVAATTEIEPAPEPIFAVEPVFEAPIEAASQPAIEWSAQPAFEVVSEPAVEFVSEPAVEPVSEPAMAAVAEPTPDWQAIHLVEHTSQTEPAVAIAAIAEPEPVRDAAEADPVRAIYRAIDGAADLSQVLDALVDGVGTLFPRAALFVVKTKSKRLQGWRSVGFTGVAAITREFEFPLTTDSALTRAVTASRTIFTGDRAVGSERRGLDRHLPGDDRWTRRGGRARRRRRARTATRWRRSTAIRRSISATRSFGWPANESRALTMSARAAFGSVMNVAPVEATPAVGAGREHAVERHEHQQRARERNARQRFTRRAAGHRGPGDGRGRRQSGRRPRTPRSSSPKSIATARPRPPRPGERAPPGAPRGADRGRADAAAAPGGARAGLGARTVRRSAGQDAGNSTLEQAPAAVQPF